MFEFLQDFRTIWIFYACMGILVEFLFFAYALPMSTRKAYALPILGFVPALFVGVGMPMICTELVISMSGA